MEVRDIMTKEVVTVTGSMDVHELAKLFIEKDISGAPVINADGSLAGLVLEESLIFQDKKIHLPSFFNIIPGFISLGAHQLEEEVKKIAAHTVEQIMDKEPMILTPETDIRDVATSIVEGGIHYFPVVENDKLVGVVTKKDIVRAIAQGKL